MKIYGSMSPTAFCLMWMCLFLVWLTNAAEDGFLYKGLYTNGIEEAEVTIPKKVSAKGEHISHDLTSFHDDTGSPIHFNVTISNKEHLLVLNPSRHFLAPGIIVERHKRDVHVRQRPKREVVDCHFEGVVHGQSNSRVALSACNGLAGLIHTGGERYFIEPSQHVVRKVHPGHKHLIYKRAASNHSKRKRKKRKKRHVQNCGTREPKRMTELEWQKQMGRIRVQEKRRKHGPRQHKITFDSVKHSNLQKHKYKKLKNHRKVREKRSYSRRRFVEALLVADSSMVEFHDNDGIEVYLLTIMNMVSSLYSDPSIGNFIKVVVVKIILLDDPIAESDLNVTVNADTTLKNFCKWQKSLNPGDDSHPHHHDVAILVTRKDICARKNTPCNTLGVAHVAGMCKSDKSCSVNEDNGITLAHTITHEMGHNFGMYHDTDKIGCKGKVGRKLHIMTPSFEADTVEVSWSKCSRRDVTNFLDKGLGECLQDEPQAVEVYKYPALPPGAMYNAEYQCRLQFGDYAQVCTPPSEICSRLWCSVNDSCTTQLRPAAPGTHCGKHMWCQEQKCVPIMEPPVAIHGGWGEWSSWSECSRSCGAGVSIMQRECDHPKPASGGKFCVGERRRYRICNTDPCPPDEPTFRAVQCTTFNNRTYEGKKYTWVPYFDQAEPCDLYCNDANDTVIVPWGLALDGTPCNVGSRDVCISGICKKVGCDWVVDSDAQEDACGVCQGDGSKCRTIEDVYNKQSIAPGYREMFLIPSGSRNIRIEEVDFSENYVSIGSVSSKKFFLNGKGHITLPGEYTVAGAQALYERENEVEKIRIPGPIRESIMVYIIFRGKVKNPGVHYQFTISKREDPKEVLYTWVLGDWSQCSVTCGGGVQHRRPVCQESIAMSMGTTIVDGTSTIVDESLCDPEELPPELMRACKDDPCASHWWIGPWQACPVTCSTREEKQHYRRSVMCVDGREMALPDHFCDSNTKPREYEPCTGLPLCNQERR